MTHFGLDYCRLMAEIPTRDRSRTLPRPVELRRRNAKIESRQRRRRTGFRDPVSVKSTIFKVQLQVNNIDCNHFHTHSLTLARHPSETDERLMVRLLAFALHAHDTPQFARGLAFDEPDLWRKDLTGAIDLWITVGQPDEQQMRRACGRARHVIVYTYSGRSAQVWWQKNGVGAARSRNLTVVDLAAEA